MTGRSTCLVTRTRPGRQEVVLVEPYLAGTSSVVVSRALADRPHRLLALGVGRVDLHRYGSPAGQARWHGLDTAGIRPSVRSLVG